MCSSPKGGRTKPFLSNKVESTFSDMSAAEYSDMVRIANESYERRQEELIEFRKNRKKISPKVQHEIIGIPLYERVKNFLSQQIFSK